MNHNQDIDDGYDEYQEAVERQQAETQLRRFFKYLNYEFDGSPFLGEKLQSIHLSGNRTTGTGNHPYDFESGFMSILGRHKGLNRLLNVRWHSNGDVVELSLEAAR